MKRKPNDAGFSLDARWRFCNRCDREFWSLSAGNRRCRQCEAKVSAAREVERAYEFAYSQQGSRIIRKRVGPC